MKKTFHGQDNLCQVYDFHHPCWRVKYQDGDWEEPSKGDMKRLRATDEATINTKV